VVASQQPVARDLRVCFLGDSFVAGVGDPTYQGWVGRIARRTRAAGLPLTAYNLGVRGQTSIEIAGRWHREAAPRLPPECDNRLVVSFGVNDTTLDGTRTRVDPRDSQDSLHNLLHAAAARHLPVLVVGPPPVADAAQTERTARLDQVFAAVCQEQGTAYVPVLHALQQTTAWKSEVRNGDGAHPGAAGYQELADLVYPTWWHLLQRPADPHA
jgi:acyl-CoA thioesterase-1